jgi:hypothetical protein
MFLLKLQPKSMALFFFNMAEIDIAFTSFYLIIQFFEKATDPERAGGRITQVRKESRKAYSTLSESVLFHLFRASVLSMRQFGLKVV